MAKLLGKLVRYATVSVIATAVSLSVLGVLVASHALSAAWANVVAVAVGTVPSFELNRRWVWGKRGSRGLLAEVAPFCALSFAGLGLSTVSVGAAAAWASRAGLTGPAATLVVEGAHVAAFGSLWVLQYVLLDRALFRSHPLSPPTIAAPVGRLPAEVTS